MSGKRTKLTKLGRNARKDRGLVNPPVERASTILFETKKALDFAVAHKNDVPYYGRRGTETHNRLRDAMTELDGGAGCVLYPSGLAAIAQCLMAFLRPGDHVLMTDSAYEPSRVFCDLTLKRLGIKTTYYDPLIGEGVSRLIRNNTKIVFTESPGSLTFEVQDIPAIAKAAQASGALVLMDNTWATPYFFRALDKGVDVVIHAATKYIAGHSDVMMGMAVANEKAFDRLRTSSFTFGQCVGADDAYTVLRGLRTLAVRLDKHEKNGVALAQWLQRRPEVDRVLHPALPGDPGHKLWQRDFDGASGLFSVVLKQGDEAALAAFLDGLELFGIGFSWGGYESLILPADPTANRNATTWTASGPLLRFHAGLEDLDDLTADLEKAFDRLNQGSGNR